VKPFTLREVADAILPHRDLEIPEAPSDEPPSVLAAFDEAFTPAWELRSRCRDDADALLRRLHELDEMRRVASAVGGAAGDRLLLLRGRDGRRRRYANKRVGRADAWGGAGNKGTVIEALEHLDEAVEAALARAGSALAADTAAWLRGYLDEYAAVKRERNLLDFRDLAICTRDLLRDRPSVRRRVADRFDEILIDEMQDTDPLQMEIALMLAADGDVPPDPFDAPLVPGKLFLVGDPKQSIYRFRRADIELYESVRQRIGGDEPAAVSTNFRSHPAVLDFVNRVFAGWMEPPDGARWQARYAALVPSRSADDPDDPRVSLVLPDPAVAARLGQIRSAERAELEVDAVARTLRRLLGRDDEPAATIVDPDTGKRRAAQPRDVAVIVRKTDWGDRLLDRLRRLGVPATITGGRRFWAHEEIETLVTLLDAMVEPENRLARFASLRSPALGLRDDELVAAFLRDDGDLEGDSPPAVADAVTRLQVLAADARRLSVPDFLERLTEELTLLTVFGLRADGGGRVESLRILIEAADAFVDAGFDSLPAFVRWLKDQKGEARGEGPGEPDPGEGGGVQILTIHKAKGLEFPIVVLADLAGRAQTRDAIVADRASGRIAFRLSQPTAVETTGFAEAWDEERLRQKAEEVRLLYVAMTRARDRLYLSWPEGTGGFLDRDSQLARRVGCEPGSAPPDGCGLGVVRAADLPALDEVGPSSSVDPEALTPPTTPPIEPPARELARRGVRILTATSLAGDEAQPDRTWEDLPLFAPGPGGRAFGTLVHRALERWDPEAPDAAAAIAAAARSVAPTGLRFGDHEIEEAIRYLERVTADPAVSTIWRAPRVLREVPFVLPADEDFVTGTLDVLVEESDGTLSIVDWKTDRIGRTPGETAKERYRTQASTYAWAAAEITGKTVREVRFVFLSSEPVETGSFAVSAEFGLEARSRIGAARTA
jgi:ATP-dependent helicase/nuclease subunit A